MKAVIDRMILTLETGHRKKQTKQIWGLGVGAVVMLILEELKSALILLILEELKHILLH